MQTDWLLRLEPPVKLVALQHLRNRKVRCQPDRALVIQLPQPFRVVTDLGLLGIQNPEHLLLIGLRIRVNLLARQRLPRHITPCRVADQRSKVAHQKNHRVPKLLKVPQLAHQYRVSQVQIRRRRVKPRLHAQRRARLAALFQALSQIAHANNLRRTLLQQIHLLVYR